MQLTILGCNGPFPAAGGATSGYMLECQDTTLLLDCGSGILGRLLERMDPARLAAVCLTHLHYDHTCDMLPLQYYLAGTDKRLKVYLPKEDHSPMRAMLDAPVFDLKEYRDPVNLGMIEMSSCPTRHPVPCRALKLRGDNRTLVYTGDAAEGESLVEFCRGADVLLADGAFMESQWHENAPHMSALRAALLARDAGVKQLLITHVPPTNVPALLLKEAKTVFPECQIVTPGKQYRV